MKKLSPRLRLFPHEYVVDLNATKAAERCGYSKKTARQQGARLLSNVYIKKAIAQLLEKRTNELVMTREEILEELSIIGRAKINHFMEVKDGRLKVKNFEDMPEREIGALESIKEDLSISGRKITFKLHPKIPALELLGRHQGLFPTKIEGDLNLKGGTIVNVITAVPRPEETAKK
jgi:phage terminase small subunit